MKMLFKGVMILSVFLPFPYFCYVVNIPASYVYELHSYLLMNMLKEYTVLYPAPSQKLKTCELIIEDSKDILVKRRNRGSLILACGGPFEYCIKFSLSTSRFPVMYR